MNSKNTDPVITSKTPPDLSSRNNALPFLNVALVGGGEICYKVLKYFDHKRLSLLNMKIAGVADVDKGSPGFVLAVELNIFTATDFKDLYRINGLNLIVDLTGSDKIGKEILRTKPEDVSLIDYSASRFLWPQLLNTAEEAGLAEHPQTSNVRRNSNTQTILDSLPYRIMVVNENLTISMVNRTFLQEKKLFYKDVLGQHCYEVRYGLKQPCVECGRPCFMEEVKKSGTTFSTIYEYMTPEGEDSFDVITASPILDENDGSLQLLEASRDVTKRIRLEREVQKSQIFLQNVIQSTVDGIVVVDTKGYVLIFNEGMERLTRYSAKEVEHLTSFYNIDLAKENMRKMRARQYGPVGKVNPTGMSITTKDGRTVPVMLSGSIIKINGKEVGSVGIFTDMREILKMRKELEDAHLQLVQSEKIASVGRMAAGVAHEINNPLSGILIFSELLQENLKGNPQDLSDIQEIIDQTLRCKKIVSELLEFSRESIGKASSFSIDWFIDKCLNLLINQASFQDIQISKEIEPDMPEMVGDIGQLQQVFTNLFVNAADAMKGKGQLRVEAGFDSYNSEFVIKVADTGPGIPQGLRHKIFDIFFTTKPVGEGTGLGLSISQNIIKLHGGTITFECPPKGGTTFIIKLPLEYLELSVEKPVFLELESA